MNSSPRGRGAHLAEEAPDLAHLTLAELREYRARLTHEEERVSYWRRLVQARLDLLVAARRKLGELTHAELVKALGGTGLGTTRNALLTVSAGEPLPELPGLQDLWTTSVDPHDQPAVAASHRALSDAADRLTAYRSALHSRLAEATGELIIRYSRAPETCLDLLPLDRDREDTPATEPYSR